MFSTVKKRNIDEKQVKSWPEKKTVWKGQKIDV